MDLSIRIATAADADAMIAFNQAMALETEGKRLSAEVLRPGVEAVFADPQKGFYVVAESDRRVVGGLMVTFEWSDWRNAWFWWIQSVYVLPEARGTGVFRRLYYHVKARAAGENVCGFRLYVETENTRAQGVYQKLGMSRSHYLMYEEMI
jgi:GNAT superfamily N-acetyltransferase